MRTAVPEVLSSGTGEIATTANASATRSRTFIEKDVQSRFAEPASDVSTFQAHGSQSLGGRSAPPFPTPATDDADDSFIPRDIDPIDPEAFSKLSTDTTVVETMPTATPVHIGGNTGTGKSALALLILRDIIKNNPKDNIVYRHGQVFPGCFIYYRGTVWINNNTVNAFHNGLLMRLLTADFTRPVWTILDGAAAIPTGTPEANLIVLTSPGEKSDALRHFRRMAINLVNPPWTLDEIDLLRRGAYPHLTKDQVKAEYEKWGGVPRILLDWANDLYRHTELSDSIYLADTTALFRQADLAAVDHSTVSGVHFHLIPGLKAPDSLINDVEATFRYPAYRWASPWLADRFWEELQNNEGDIQILNFLLNRNNSAAARALAFEPHVFRTFQNHGLGGRFKSLDEPTAPFSNFTLTGYTRRPFFNFEDLPDDPSAYVSVFYVPQQPNHESFDLYVPDQGFLVQVTVGKEHNVKRKGLEAAANSKLFRRWKSENQGAKLKIVFLCDQYNFLNFTRLPYIGAKGTALEQTLIIAGLDQQFSQHAWELDVRRQCKEHLQTRDGSLGWFGEDGGGGGDDDLGDDDLGDDDGGDDDDGDDDPGDQGGRNLGSKGGGRKGWPSLQRLSGSGKRKAQDRQGSPTDDSSVSETPSKRPRGSSAVSNASSTRASGILRGHACTRSGSIAGSSRTNPHETREGRKGAKHGGK